MNAVILAGGKGTRLAPLSGDLPKPLVPLAGRPLLEYLFDLLRHYKITDVILCTGFGAEKIEAWAGNGAVFGLTIRYSKERVPLGTAGALKHVPYQLNSTFLVLYADVLAWLDLEALVHFHRQRAASATLVVHPTHHPEDSDLVEMDINSRITRFLTKRGGFTTREPLASAALYVFEPHLLSYIPQEYPKDLARDMFPMLLSAGERLYGYLTDEYLKDVGTPDRYNEAVEDLCSGRYPNPYIQR